MNTDQETSEKFFELYRVLKPYEVDHCGLEKVTAYDDLKKICAENFGAGSYIALEVGKSKQNNPFDRGYPLSYWGIKVLSTEYQICQRIHPSQKNLERVRTELSKAGGVGTLFPSYFEAMYVSRYIENVREPDSSQGGAEPTEVVDKAIDLLRSGLRKRQIEVILTEEFSKTIWRDYPPDRIKQGAGNAYEAAKKRVNRKKRKEASES